MLPRVNRHPDIPRRPRIASSVPASSARELSRPWSDRLAAYRNHRNDEHLEALVDEAARYAGLHLENDLSRSPYWSKASLGHRVAVLLYLVDRGVVERHALKSRRTYQPRDDAEVWVLAQPSLTPYATPTLELLAALRNAMSRHNRPAQP
jgi:hypothetical protein